ncbi:site-specific tyrosine recombinase XerD [Schaalia vaccimaxillae]|uniref:site-specific tyrosine recombinase XerD n=1 Tax=Schaalia vaccimaxillae TaxID=183916 RepID=UPI0003B4A8BD|nr:site-specific tyrosine recombinase XerD [Schaalia vaccimaxillae]
MESLQDTAQDWLDQLRVEKGASPHTVSNYRRDVDRYLADLARRQITAVSSVTPNMIEEHLRRLASGELTGSPAAPSSIARAAASIRSLHRFAVKEGLVADDPSARIRPPQQGQHLPKALTVDEVARLLDAAHVGDDPMSLRDAALLEVLYATGGRVSEVVALCVDDIDLNDDLPVVRLFGKGRKERLVPLGHYAKEALAAYLVRARPGFAAKGTGTPEIFLNNRGKPLSRQSAWEAIQRCAQAADLDRKISPHTLRHSFATHLLEGGATVRDVQELLGHASVQTTQIYTRVTVTTLREIYRSSHPRARGGAEPRT